MAAAAHLRSLEPADQPGVRRDESLVGAEQHRAHLRGELLQQRAVCKDERSGEGGQGVSKAGEGERDGGRRGAHAYHFCFVGRERKYCFGSSSGKKTL